MNGNNQIFTEADAIIEWVRVKDIEVVWESAQREKSQPFINQIEANFDKRMFGIISVTGPVDKTGRRHVINGQHRVSALKQMGLDGEMIPCHVSADVEDKTKAAQLFLGLNRTTTVSSVETFLKGVTAGEEIPVTVNMILRNAGWTPSRQLGEGHARAVAAYMNTTRRYGAAHFKLTVDALTAVWDHHPEALSSSVFTGAAKVLAVPGIDIARFCRVVGTSFSEPHRLRGAGMAVREVARRGSVSDGCAAAIVSAYNVGLRTNKITLDN